MTQELEKKINFYLHPNWYLYEWTISSVEDHLNLYISKYLLFC